MDGWMDGWTENGWIGGWIDMSMGRIDLVDWGMYMVYG
jgi:hypothetical protein